MEAEATPLHPAAHDARTLDSDDLSEFHNGAFKRFFFLFSSATHCLRRSAAAATFVFRLSFGRFALSVVSVQSLDS